jgi:hypothetical protein
MVEAYPETEKIEWGFLPTTTIEEIARVCCGWYYKISAPAPDGALYADRLERLRSAVEAGDPAFPLIEGPLPEIGPERLYAETVPLFRPAEVYPGMRLYFPETCPVFSAHNFPEPPNANGAEQAAEVELPERATVSAVTTSSVTVTLPHLPTELATLHDIIRSLAQRSVYPAQRDVALEIGDRLNLSADPDGEPNGVARKLAAMIRPNALGNPDQ